MQCTSISSLSLSLLVGSKQVRQNKTILIVFLSETEKIHFLGGRVCLVAEDSALEDRDLVRSQAGVLACHLQQPEDLPLVCQTRDRKAAQSIVHGQHQQLAPPGLQQRFHHFQMPPMCTAEILKGQCPSLISI